MRLQNHDGNMDYERIQVVDVYMVVMLVSDSDDQSETPDQPYVGGLKDVIMIDCHGQ